VIESNVRLDYLLDSLKDAFVYCDTTHVIRYMNRAAYERFAGWPAAVGRSIFDCHNEDSNAQIVAVAERFASGEDEVLLRDGEDQRVYMRAVRDHDGVFLGYYERYEVPRQ
jgi:PAS domain-containing protein